MTSFGTICETYLEEYCGGVQAFHRYDRWNQPFDSLDDAQSVVDYLNDTCGDGWFEVRQRTAGGWVTV